MKQRIFLLWTVVALLFAGCAASKQSTNGEEREDTAINSYTQIDQETAKAMMERDDGHIVVDVRRQDEFDAGHIPGAILIPHETIEGERPAALPNLDQIILIFCRTGNRSKPAAQKLCDMGYTRLYEFGGVTTWTGPLVTSDQAAATSTPTLVIRANDRTVYATFMDNSSAQALVERLSAGPIEIDLHDYGHFEKVGPLPWGLPRNDETITTEPGDVILYQGKEITVYYDQNTWDFTRLAKIENVTKDDLLSAFGEGDVTVSFSIQWSE